MKGLSYNIEYVKPHDTKPNRKGKGRNDAQNIIREHVVKFVGRHTFHDDVNERSDENLSNDNLSNDYKGKRIVIFYYSHHAIVI